MKRKNNESWMSFVSVERHLVAKQTHEMEQTTLEARRRGGKDAAGDAA